MKTKIFLGVLCVMAAVNVFSAESTIFTYKVGNIEVTTMVENRGPGRISVLLNPDSAMIEKYLPDGNYLSEVNTFLVKTPDYIILVDTGFGTTLFDNLKLLGVNPDQIDAVLITHSHGDHVNGLQKDGKALFPNATVYIAAPEKEFWAASGASLGAYGNNVRTFASGTLGTEINDLLPGIKAVAAPGHTPGHTMFMAASQGEALLIVGDLIHVEDIQIPVPGQSVSFDSDPAAAASVRNAVLAYAAKNAVPIAGMHLQYPAIGLITAGGEGEYTLTALK